MWGGLKVGLYCDGVFCLSVYLLFCLSSISPSVCALSICHISLQFYHFVFMSHHNNISIIVCFYLFTIIGLY